MILKLIIQIIYKIKIYPKEMEPPDDCPICQESILLPYTLPCKHRFCYLCIKRAYEEKSACPYCRAPITENIHDDARLQMTSQQPITTKKEEQLETPTTFTWIYAGANYGHWQFDPRSDTAIEEAYTAYRQDMTKSSFTLYVMNRPYEINFVSMKQYIQRGGGRRASRDILRLPKGADGRPINTNPNITIKGIAGLQWEGEMREALPTLPAPNGRAPKMNPTPKMANNQLPTVIPKRKPPPFQRRINQLPVVIVDSDDDDDEAVEEEEVSEEDDE